MVSFFAATHFLHHLASQQNRTILPRPNSCSYRVRFGGVKKRRGRAEKHRKTAGLRRGGFLKNVEYNHGAKQMGWGEHECVIHVKEVDSGGMNQHLPNVRYFFSGMWRRKRKEKQTISSNAVQCV